MIKTLTRRGLLQSSAVAAALPADLVTFDEPRRLLRIVYQPAPGHAAEDVIGLALRALLDQGARVAGVRRGTSLEKKFLEMTAARVPKMKKSYHSKAVPAAEAATTVVMDAPLARG